MKLSRAGAPLTAGQPAQDVIVPAPTAVLLDLDGTLTDSAPVILAALRATLAELGLEAGSDAELMRYVGPPLVEGFRINAGLEGEDNRRAVEVYRSHYRQTMTEAPLYPGVRELLESLRAAGLPVALATSKNETMARRVLEAARLAPYFTVIAGAGEGDVGGTKAEVVRAALDRLAAAGADVSNPVHVGDLDHDVQGARAQGVDCVGVLWGYGSQESLQGAVALARDTTELARLLGAPAPEASQPQAAGQGSSQAPVRLRALDSLPEWLVRVGVGAWLAIGVTIAVGLVFFATSKVIPVFIGVFIALVLTAMLNPLSSFLRRFMPRYAAATLSLLIALGAVAGLLVYVVNSVIGQWEGLARELSQGMDTIIAFLEHGPLPFHVTQQQLSHQLALWLSQSQDYLQSNAPTLASEVLSNASTLVDVFAVLALALFTTIFFLASGPRMWRWFLEELPVGARGPVHRAAGAGWYTFSGYARGTVLVALTDAIMAGIFLQLVGVPLAAPLAVLVFIGAFIPIIGAPVAMIIAMLVALASGGPFEAVVVGLGVAGIGQVEGHILQPLIMGRQVSLHPVVVIVAVAVGTYSAGLLGAIVAVPLISVLWSVYAELHDKAVPIQGELPSFRNSRG